MIASQNRTNARTKVRAGERGVTLIELSITIVVASLAMSAITMTAFNWHKFYNRQLDAAFGQQNARVSLEVVKDYMTRAGYGFVAHTSLQGILPVGGCFDDGGLDSLDCNGVDGGTDRVRVYYGIAEGTVRTLEGDPATGTGSDGIPLADQTLWSIDPHADISMTNRYALISGQCESGEYGSDFVLITGDSPGDRNAHHNYVFTNLATGTADFVGCPLGYRAYNFGPASVADFFIDRGIPRHPTLKMRIDSPTGSWADAMVLATDIDTMQVQYGIDTGVNDGDASQTRPDGLVDQWCNDPTSFGGCSATGLAEREIQARIIAVRLAVVARTRIYREDLDRPGTYRLPVQDYEIPDRSDGYNRFVYRTTVSMRNNDLILRDDS